MRIPPPKSSGPEVVPVSVDHARGGKRAVGLFWRLAQLQTGRPWTMLAMAVASVVLAVLLASQLGFKSSFGELLPENKESVIIAEQVAERLPAVSILSLVIQGDEGCKDEALKRFVDALAPELRALGPEWVGMVDDGVQQAQQFFEDNKFLYAPLDLVEEVHDEINERYDYEVHKRAGTLLDEDDPPEPLTEESIRKRIEKRRGKGSAEQKAKERYPDGYYLDPESHTIVVLLRTPVSSGDVERSEALKQKVGQVIDRVDPKRFDPSIQIGLTGNLITSYEEYRRIVDDLAHVGLWGIVLILSVVFLFYLRVRTVLAMTLSVGIGTAWTFGLAYLLIGHLNKSTGFLFSIVVGNGINFGIIYMARYLEARRTRPPERSAFVAHRETWLSTLTASAAATAAYGSLVVTDFRGFKHFGIIGGSGMLLCWLATYLFLPSILAVTEKVRAVKPPAGVLGRLRGLYGRPFAYLAGKGPRTITAVAFGLGLVCLFLSARFVAGDPLEYDLDNIANEPSADRSAARTLGHRVDKIVGRQGQDGIAVMTDTVEQVRPLQRELERRREAAPADRKPFDKVVTIHSLLPEDQEKKIALLQSVRGRLEKAHRKGYISDEDWQKIEEFLPPKDLRPLGIADLPEQVARAFTEKDGTRGRLVYIVPATGRSVWDAHYLIDWAESFRTTTLPDGSVVKGSGNQVIFADLIMAVEEDAPKALLVSLLTTLLIVLTAFRLRASALWVVGSVLLGLGWTMAILAVWNTDWSQLGQPDFAITPLRINFLNFVAIPITIGVGADYAVNIMQRYRLGLTVDIRRVIVETGGAVILCSLTTTLGYSALTLSVNRAVKSFGIAVTAGEICCVVAAVLALPACLMWLHHRRAAHRARNSHPGEVLSSRPSTGGR